MNEEIDESEFYHEDFTTASDWEIFIAHIEEIINQWKSEAWDESEQKDLKKSWYTRSEKLVFIDTNFDLLWYKKILEEDVSESSDQATKHPLNSWHDFTFITDPHNDHKDICLANWYGLSEFIVLGPAGDGGNINNESKVKILLSSVCVLISNSNLDVPVFIQIREKWQKLYLGIYEANSIRTNFDMVHLKKSPHYCQYLNGILDVFKSKIMSPCTIDNIIVSFQVTYVLENFSNFVWKQGNSDHLDVEDLFILPFGVTTEPINSIIFKAVWNHLSEHSLIDSESYTDFQPSQAPKWYCGVNLTENPVSLLGECLSEYSQILTNSSTAYDLLGDFVVMPMPVDNNPLDVLTEPAVPTISSLLNRASITSLSKNRKGVLPLPDSTLVPLLYFLFPDADENSLYLYREDKELTQRKCKIFENMDEEFKGFKTCAEDLLPWRLAIVLSHCLQSLGGLKAFCQLWYEFVQEMRYRWEKSTMILG
ncbi:rab3 GTPase-activating protein catalytic subunit-like [Sitophilus oryzae]|uniref:Rab3 GTPase-activating protein catalytic subunit-like n=1 Tax=Sitophilus oryzae TaxID=7048 RepID=A0A6J2YKS2_SITOR|nr:rab3 GTPase-activating protein catalytic subunit-like [Sitophilus oryzae]